jgi:hypothetical protein
MPKSSWSFNKILFTVAAIIALGVVLQSTGLFAGGCKSGDSFRSCDGDNSIVQVCSNGIWQTTNTSKATSSQACFEGTLIDKTCIGDTNTCLNSYTILESKCESSKPVLTKKICGNSEYCNNGNCIPKPSSCYNSICDIGENMDNCPADCGSLSSWQKYYDSIPADIKTEYGSCISNSIYDCSDPIYQEAINDIQNKYNPKTPKEFIDAVTTYTHNLIKYKLNGGDQQCNEAATKFLQNYLHPPYYGYLQEGNCVDFSLVETNILRAKGFGGVRQISACLTHDYSAWNCQPYAITGVKTEIIPPMPLGYINGLAAGEGGSQPLGHALLQVWVDGSWNNVDPTMGSSISRQCLGYSSVLSVGGGKSTPSEVCYVPTASYLTCSSM